MEYNVQLIQKINKSYVNKNQKIINLIDNRFEQIIEFNGNYTSLYNYDLINYKI